MFLQKQNLFPCTVTSNNSNNSGSDSFNFNEINAEQDCLFRLKAQRQKVEELESINQDRLRQLQQKDQIIAQLKAKVDELTVQESYRDAYEELKGEYEDLFFKYEEENKENELTKT